MNQILVEINKKNNSSLVKTKHKNKLKTFFKFQFVICCVITISTTIYYAYSLYENNRKENLSKKILSNFNITNLYNNTDYNAIRTASLNTYEAEDTKFSVIGLIEIKRIKINYPIISEYNTELLKIAPCRFIGPMPNEVGNLCIAGHNYNSYKFFSKLKDLVIGDVISIYDLYREKNRLFSL